MADVTPDVLQDLAPAGVLRAGINFGNPVLAQRDVVTSEACGVSVDLARELGRRLGVTVALVCFDSAGKLFEGVKSDVWEVAFMAIDPARSTEILFTPPYLLIEGTYLVRSDSPLTPRNSYASRPDPRRSRCFLTKGSMPRQACGRRWSNSPNSTGGFA